MKKICAFSTADDGYAVSAAISLLTVRKYQPNLDMFIIGREYTAKTKKFLKKYNITPIEVNLDDIFHTAWEYPRECYYIFAGPEILAKKGYDYSVYVDGDIYCNNDPLTFSLSKVKDFAGAFTSSRIRDILGDDTDTALELYGNKAILEEPRIQTGVVYFNNKSLAKKGLLEKIGKVYQEAFDNDIPRKGDDSLLALFRMAYPSWDYLNLTRSYNIVTRGGRPRWGEEWLTTDQEMISLGVFAHFTNHTKPWKTNSFFPTYTYEYFYHAWRRHAIDTLSDDELLEYYPEIAATLSDEHLRFYWYPTKNVGDLITPYFLEKTCGLNPKQHVISEKTIHELERLQVTKNFTERIRRFIAKLRRKRSGLPLKRALYCVSTGSVIRLCGDHAMVYGSGIRSSDQEVHRSFVRSVRGPLTRKRFIESKYPCAPIYGDPGLLMPKYYTPKKPRKKYDIGLVPHFTEYEEVVEKYKNDKTVLVIDMGCGDLEKVIDQLASCKRTISSSLHGLVLSHAYGIPTRQILYSDKIMGDGTKFRDYYMGIGLRRIEPIKAAGSAYIPPAKLLKLKYETLENYDASRLQSAMFFDENGLKKSARYPYA